jgi:hypothetical protein
MEHDIPQFSAEASAVPAVPMGPYPGALMTSPPVSAPGSVFRRFCYRYGVVGNVCLGVGFLLPPLAIACGAVLAGSAGVVAGTGAGFGAFWALMNRVTVYGNLRLRDELARRLGVRDPAAEFVGLCLPENNTVQGKLLTMRLETDDNVGFLCLDDEALTIRMEEGELQIARADIREVTEERFVELPYLRWIAVEYYEHGCLRTVLLCSRQCRTLREARHATEALLERLVDWYTEPVVRDLERERWDSLEP